MLKIQDLSITYADQPVLKSIYFSLKRGERIVIVGESGCGKTTLLKTIAGHLQPNSGGVWFEGERVLGPKEQLVPGHSKIKLVNQDFGLDDFHSVEENIRLKLLQYNTAYIQARIEELLKVTGLEKFRNYQAKLLSGGQKQRLSIARALADEPELLLLDEPFNQLDYFLKQKIENYIDNYLKKHDISVILVSHSGEETMRWGEKALFLKSGKITRKDTLQNFYDSPKNRKEAGFFGLVNTVFIEGKYYSFRPQNFAFKTNESMIRVPLIHLKTIYKGWYYDHIYKVGNRTVNLYHSTEIIGLTEIYIKPMFT